MAQTATIDPQLKPWREVFAGREAELAELQSAWRRVRAGQPHLVALTAESGFGKTRLAQEFYNWLSTAEDGVGGAGYWPDRLGWVGDNLRVNPDLTVCRPEHPMPFLWWGLRCPDPGARNQLTVDALAAHLPDLVPHLEPMHRARAKGEAWKRAGIKAAFALADLIPVVGGAISAVKDGAKILREIRSVPDPADTPGARDSLAAVHHASLADRVLHDLAAVLTGSGEVARVPAIVLVDDVHWAPSEPAMMGVLDGLLRRAFAERWPLLILVTSWAKEWAEQECDVSPSLPRSIQERLGHDVTLWTELPLDKGSRPLGRRRRSAARARSCPATDVARQGRWQPSPARRDRACVAAAPRAVRGPRPGRPAQGGGSG